MRVAGRILVLGMTMCVLGAADARAPALKDSATTLATATTRPESSGPSHSQWNSDPQLALNRSASNDSAGSAVANDAGEPTPDGWLLGGICLGLVAYQLRRKHRQLRPHPFQLRSDA